MPKVIWAVISSGEDKRAIALFEDKQAAELVAKHNRAVVLSDRLYAHLEEYLDDWQGKICQDAREKLTPIERVALGLSDMETELKPVET